MLVCVVIFLLIAWIYLRQAWDLPKGFPKGPRRPLPILGDWSILFMQGPIKDRIYQLGKPYDDIFGMWLGSHPVVFVKSYDLMASISNHPSALGKLLPSHSCKNWQLLKRNFKISRILMLK